MLWESFSTSSLLLYLVYLLLQPLGVCQILIFQHVKVFIKLVDQRNRSGNVQLSDVLIRNIAENLDDSSQTVTMSHYQHFFSRFDSWDDCFVPARQDSIDCYLQTLSQMMPTSVLGRSSGLISL